MLDLTEEYNKIIKDIEKKVTDLDQLQYVKEKISEIFMVVLDKIEQIIENYEVRLEHIVAHQQRITEKVDKMENSLNMIEKDIYEDEIYDFQVVCPYCNHEFVADIDMKNDITCPECKNIIELDWSAEDQEQEGCNRRMLSPSSP